MTVQINCAWGRLSARGSFYVSPLLGEVLSLARPRESTQREGQPTACPDGHTLYAHQGSLRVSGFWAFAQLAGRIIPPASSNKGAHLLPKALRCSAAPTGFGWWGLAPLVQPSTAGKTGTSAPPVRARSERKRDRRVGRTPVFSRSAGNPVAHRGCATGPTAGSLFFWFVFFGGTKKMNSPKGAKQEPE